ncbi:MAG TPA: hypothetical protein DCP92_07655 [Nitrospiraceae bacterium]|jgi:hypothetical protein|nr:hypothetical protein [Nitrospiraceae bacterium]
MAARKVKSVDKAGAGLSVVNFATEDIHLSIAIQGTSPCEVKAEEDSIVVFCEGLSGAQALISCCTHAGSPLKYTPLLLKSAR